MHNTQIVSRPARSSKIVAPARPMRHALAGTGEHGPMVERLPGQSAGGGDNHPAAVWNYVTTASRRRGRPRKLPADALAEKVAEEAERRATKAENEGSRYAASLRIASQKEAEAARKASLAQVEIGRLKNVAVASGLTPNQVNELQTTLKGIPAFMALSDDQRRTLIAELLANIPWAVIDGRITPEQKLREPKRGRKPKAFMPALLTMCARAWTATTGEPAPLWETVKVVGGGESATCAIARACASVVTGAPYRGSLHHHIDTAKRRIKAPTPRGSLQR